MWHFSCTFTRVSGVWCNILILVSGVWCNILILVSGVWYNILIHSSRWSGTMSRSSWSSVQRSHPGGYHDHHHHHQVGLPQDHHGLHQGQRGVPLSGLPAVTTIRGHSPPESCWPLVQRPIHYLFKFLFMSVLIHSQCFLCVDSNILNLQLVLVICSLWSFCKLLWHKTLFTKYSK